MKLAYAVATPDTTDATMLALRGDLAPNFRLLRQLGYQGVDLMLRDPSQLDPRALLSLAGDTGLSFASISTGQLRKEDGLQLCSLNESERARAVARGQEVVELAQALGCGVNIGTFRGTLPAGDARTDALNAARASLAALLTHAAPRGVRIALEPQCRYVSNWLNTVAETKAFLAPFQPQPAILFDVYHAALEENSLWASLVEAGPLISMVQVSDNQRLPPGTGQISFPDVLRVLHALRFDGFVSVEALQRPSPEQAAAVSARYLRPLLDQLA
jgi:5-keto-L-gluconate epimerase